MPALFCLGWHYTAPSVRGLVVLEEVASMSRGGEMVYIPDDSDFNTFRDQCESQDGWNSQYNKGGVTVWSQTQEENKTVQKIKVRTLARKQS